MNKYSKFQMDTFDSFWENLTENLTDPDADADADADADTGVTAIARLFFFEKSS